MWLLDGRQHSLQQTIHVHYIHMYVLNYYFLMPSCAQTISHSHKYVCVYACLVCLCSDPSTRRHLSTVCMQVLALLSLRARKISLSALLIIFRFTRNYFIVSRPAPRNLMCWGAVVLGRLYWISVFLLLFFFCAFFLNFIFIYICTFFVLFVLFFCVTLFIVVLNLIFLLLPSSLIIKLLLLLLFVELISTLVNLLV